MASKRYAILIASSRYPDEPGLTELRCPENDVDALNEVLSSPDFGQFSKTVVFKNAPSYEILRGIETILADAGRDDLVLVYFSGHGKTNLFEQLYLATLDTNLKALGSTSIPLERLKSFFEHYYEVRSKILILDCCYSGAAGNAFAKGGGVDDQLQIMAKGQGTFIMTASTSAQIAVEKPGDSLGLFTKHLVDGIRSGEADRDEDGEIDIHELYQHVYEKVRAEDAQEPMKWDINARGRMIIAKSGNTLIEQRRQEIERNLHRLAADGLLTSRIVHEAARVLRVPKRKLAGSEQQRIVLIEQLMGSKLGKAHFMEQWMDLRCLDCAAAAKKTDNVEAKQESPAVSVEQPAPSLRTDLVTGMELVYIPAGCFMMGSYEYLDEQPVHEVCVDAFWMGKYPVTQSQWQQLMGNNPSKFQNGGNCPVERVSWVDAQTFISALNKRYGKGYRLPTEAEWEYACRAGGVSKYDLDFVAWYDKNSGRSTHPVGEKEANAFGLHDMLGNVWEWCVDWYDTDYYAISPKNNPQGSEKGSNRVLRGGCWCNSPRLVRVSYRFRSAPDSRDGNLGFRLVLPVQQGSKK